MLRDRIWHGNFGRAEHVVSRVDETEMFVFCADGRTGFDRWAKGHEPGPGLGLNKKSERCVCSMARDGQGDL